MSYKLNVLILALFLLSVTSISANAASNNAGNDLNGNSHTARVIAPKAIVYSDENLNSPLGYISNNKLITVGNPRKKNPEVIPIVIYGRLAFIQSRDINYESETLEQMNAKRGAPREHNIDIILEKPEEKLSENNSVYFQLHRFSGGTQVKDLVLNISGEDKSTFSGFGASVIHRQLTGPWFWGAGVESNSITAPNMKFSYAIFSPTVGYTPMRNSLFLVDLILSLDFSAGANLKITSNADREPNAFMYGPQMNARMVLLPNQKYHPYGMIGFRSYHVYNVESVFNSSEVTINGVDRIFGINLALGLSFEI